MSKPTPLTYRTTNWRSYNAALKQRGSLLIRFDPETVWLAEPSGKRGRSATFTDAARAIQCRRSIYIPFQKPSFLAQSGKALFSAAQNPVQNHMGFGRF